MAHIEQRVYCLKVKAFHPKFFTGTTVLDVGSLDINGSNRYLFDTSCRYTGIDIAPGRNVDAVSTGHEWGASNDFYDIIISTECFEHDMFYYKTMHNIVRMLRPGGMFLFTCATTGRREHGTTRTSPQDSPFTSSTEGWNDYYKNLTAKDVREVIDVDAVFREHLFETNERSYDLYFYGIKK